MSGWHLTWQDPVALGLAIAGLSLAWLLNRWLLDRGAASGCASCGDTGVERSRPEVTAVRASDLRLGRRPRRGGVARR